MSRSRLAALLALVCLGLPLAGCRDKKLDTSALEDSIQTGITRDLNLKVRSVTCPDNVPVKKGANFTCTIKTTAGKSIPVRVTQADNTGHVTYRLAT
jgi:hypothetical protein